MKKVLLLGILLGTFYTLSAQPGNPNNPSPIDGGLSLLVAGGALLGYRAYKHQKDSNNS